MLRKQHNVGMRKFGALRRNVLALGGMLADPESEDLQHATWWNLMKPDETWWNLMKPDDPDDILVNFG